MKMEPKAKKETPAPPKAEAKAKALKAKKQQSELNTEQPTGSKFERSISRLNIVTLLI